MAFLFSRFRLRICRFKRVVIHSGSEVLTLKDLLEIHYFVKDKIVVFKLEAYTEIASFSEACQSVEDAFSRKRPKFLLLNIQIRLVKALALGLENLQKP